MARTVADAAALLAAIAGVDPRDAATAESRGRLARGYCAGAQRLGASGRPHRRRAQLLRLQRRRGPRDGGGDRGDEVGGRRRSSTPRTSRRAGKFDDAEFEVLLYEFKADLNAYLAALGASAPHKNLAALIAFNERESRRARCRTSARSCSSRRRRRVRSRAPRTRPRGRSACACRAPKESMRRSRSTSVTAIIAPTGGPAWPTDLINGDHFTGGSSSPSAVVGLPEHHGAGRVHPRAARGHLVHRRPVERCVARGARLRVRAGDEGAKAAALRGDAETLSCHPGTTVA